MKIFYGEILGWVVRGSFCALASFCWALLGGFNHPREIAGMFVGTGSWVLIFAGLSAICLSSGRTDWDRALKRAAWIKFGAVILGLLLAPFLSLIHGMLRSVGGYVAAIIHPDLPLGIFSLGLVSRISGLSGEEQIARVDSFKWTLLTTLLDGALIAAIVLGVAACLLVWAWLKMGHDDRRRELSPVPSMD